MRKESLDGDRVFVIHDFLDEQETAALIARSEGTGFGEAPITTTAGPAMNKEIRDNARLIVDDTTLADDLWLRVRTLLPFWLDDARVVGFNERFRFYRYDPGQKFAPHYDGFFRRPNGDRSQLTFMVYLNDGYTGGETNFFNVDMSLRVSVRPQRGMALVFEHLQLHEGAPIVEGRKYVLRTDVMYTTNLAT